MDYSISSRAASLAPSLTLAISAKAKELRARGEDVIGLGAGEPDFDTPQHIKDAAAQALADGFTKYTPSSGIPELRQAVADKFQRDYGVAYEPSQIIVSCGGKHSCFNVIYATCEAGDEVIIPAPYWLSYPEMAKLAGAKPVILDTTDETEFKVTPEQLREAITPSTKLFILNSPSNPTGSVYSADEIKALGDVCVEKGVLIMSDDIYEKLLYDGAEFTSVTGFSEEHKAHTIIVHGLAKAYSMTGWRIGFLAAPKPIAQAINAVQSHSTSNATSFAQKGAVAALNGPQDHLDDWLSKFDERRPASVASTARAHFICSRTWPKPVSSPPSFASACLIRPRWLPSPASPSARTITSASATPPAWRTSKPAWPAWRISAKPCSQGERLRHGFTTIYL
jgi:aspartate aminotransferase